jgi:hypothetical protein
MDGPGREPPAAATRRLADAVDALLAPRQPPGWALALTWALVALTYVYQGVSPAFNADDIIQMQWPDDALTFLTQGRWGYYFVFAFVMHSNPAPLFSTLVGVTLIVASGLIAARILQIRQALATVVFVLIGAVSVYYGDLFSYHSTRIAYPLGNLLAIAGLLALLRRRRALGVLLLALAPGFYQAASELAAVVLAGWALRRLIRAEGLAVLPEFGKAALGLGASLALYLFGTHAAYAVLGIPMNDRMSVDPLAIVHRFGEIRTLVVAHSAPILAPSSGRYLPVSVMLCATALGAAFAAVSIAAAARRDGPRGVVAAIALNLALLVAPWFLILASGGLSAPFVPRSLYAISTVHAVWAATLLEAAAPGGFPPPRRRAAFLVACAVAFLLTVASAAHINEMVFDQYLASQDDLYATNRIIARIDDMLADTPGAPTGAIPIAVIYDRPTMSGPRGSVWTSRKNAWSREFIFRLLDRRFHWVPPERYQREWQAARTHPEWPARGSVFLDDGVVVVVVTK